MKLYKPTTAEKKKFDKILKSLTPKMAAYRKYRILVDEFLDQYSTLPWKKSLPIKNFKVVKSKLFQREFLVGYATKTWISEVAPGCNAIATTSIKLGGLESPPIVLVPAQCVFRFKAPTQFGSNPPGHFGSIPPTYFGWMAPGIC